MNTIVDFDDFSENYNSLDYLYQLKAKRPNFKVTLFVPPMKSSLPFLREVSSIKWIEMAIHGWEHTPIECTTWSRTEADQYIRTALDWGVFVKGFKAPQWAITKDVYDVCRENDIWVADNSHRGSAECKEIPRENKIYLTNGDDIVPGTKCNGSNEYNRIHGHISWWPGLDNDIRLLFHYIIDVTQEDTNFFFISEIIKKFY